MRILYLIAYRTPCAAYVPPPIQNAPLLKGVAAPYSLASRVSISPHRTRWHRNHKLFTTTIFFVLLAGVASRLIGLATSRVGIASTSLTARARRRADRWRRLSTHWPHHLTRWHCVHVAHSSCAAPCRSLASPLQPLASPPHALAPRPRRSQLVRDAVPIVGVAPVLIGVLQSHSLASRPHV